MNALVASPKIKIETKPVAQTVRLWKIVIHDDAITAWDFVKEMLVQVFRRSANDAQTITYLVHTNGCGVAGIFTKEVADTKIKIANDMVRLRGYPLRLSSEPV